MKTRVSHKAQNVEGRFASWIKMAIDLIAPKNLYLVAGRSMDIIYDMPGSYQVFVADTYVNAHKNVIPTLLEGWQRKGWVHGVHYVTDERPPKHFKLPYKPVDSYKNTISVFNGCFFNLVSMDQPSGAAGNSYQHIYGDEAKYLDPDKLKKLTPALRGEYVSFGHSVYYRGRTFTTDMPNVADKEFDWILEQEQHMDKEQVKLALYAGLELNTIKKQYYNACRDGDHSAVKRVQKNIARWTERWIRARKDSTFFYVVSSYVNAEVLTPGYFSDSLEALGVEEYKSAIISLKADIKKGEKFYMNLGTHHFFDDGVNTKFYEQYAIGEDFDESSLALRYIRHDKPLDAGVDFGDMCSMVLGQEAGRYYYCLKNLYTLAPESSKELAVQFINFFKYHKAKTLNLYYDRSGNQYSRIRRDWANELKDHLENLNGAKTGWHVNLMSRNQATIYQEEEYNLMKKLMGEYYPGLPKLKICRFQCRELKSSLELTKTKTRKDTKTGATGIFKDKSSEKLPLQKLPMYSTNFSDAFKYLLYRPEYVKIAEKRDRGTSLDPEVV